MLKGGRLTGPLPGRSVRATDAGEVGYGVRFCSEREKVENFRFFLCFVFALLC